MVIKEIMINENIVFVENYIVDEVDEIKEMMIICREIISLWDDKAKLKSFLEFPTLGLCSNLCIRIPMQEYFANMWPKTHINSTGFVSFSYPIEGSNEYYLKGEQFTTSDERFMKKWSNPRRLEYAIHILEILEKLTRGRDGY